MKNLKIRNNQKFVNVLIISVLSMMMFSILFFAGCTSTLEGDVYENKKPIVYFATIPPEGQDFSSNPVIYWYGTDNDGLIDYYRYHIATKNVVGDLPPEDYIMTVSQDDWTYIDVDPADADPNTKNSLPYRNHYSVC